MCNARRLRLVASLTLVASLAACGASSTSTPAGEDVQGDTPIEGDAATGTDGAADTGAPEADAPSDGSADAGAEARCTPLRVATYNASLFRNEAGQLLRDLQAGDAQAEAVAHVIRTVRPQVLLLNEFDVDLSGTTAQAFIDGYLNNAALTGSDPIDYAYVWVAPSNTGLSSTVDLDSSGSVVAEPGSPEYAADSFGFGVFEGQYGFIVLSQFPIDTAAIQTFQELRWVDLPGAELPDNADTAEAADWYSAEARAVFRLSSKNHADVPVLIDGTPVHVLASHPTPPAFDGAEDRNGLRNQDEIRLWVQYLNPAAALQSDQGRAGGLPEGEHFVIVGDLNNDPFDPVNGLHAIGELIAHPRVQASPTPSSRGAVEAAEEQGQANTAHVGDPSHDTADFSDGAVGNLRADYALPSASMFVSGSGVFWPATDEPGREWVAGPPVAASDHHLTWVDVQVPSEAGACDVP